jgi:general secretion pathway protein G
MTRHAGFTLIELIITVAIVSLIATAAMPFAQLVVKRGKEQELRAALREIRTGIDAYKLASEQGRIEQKVDTTGYPPNLEVLVDGVEDASSPDHRIMFFLRRVPRDPFSPDTSVMPAASWGLRSYASPPEDPRAGDDVFDVYSLATGNALDGTAYRDW